MFYPLLLKDPWTGDEISHVFGLAHFGIKDRLEVVPLLF